MKENQTIIQVPYLDIFNEESWPKYLPQKYLINSHTFYIDQNDTEFFIDDCTNPDYNKLKIKDQIEQVIKEKLDGQSFLKVYGRTAKDINITMSKLLSVHDLTMAIKMSQFLTQALDDQLQNKLQQKQTHGQKQIKLKFTLREYKNYLQSPTHQYRIYLLNENLVAMCQKVPNHISVEPNEHQIEKAKQIGKNVYDGIIKILQNMENACLQAIKAKVIVDCFISESGKKAKILSIDPTSPFHCLSLFSELQIKSAYENYETTQNKQSLKILLKHITHEEEFKQVDLSSYRVGWQLGDKQALSEWKAFIKQN